MRNKPTTSNVNIVNNSGSGLDDISSSTHTPVSSTSSTPDINLGYKQKVMKTNSSQSD